jgi:transposase-like protein
MEQTNSANHSQNQETKPPCPYCGQTAPVVKAGLNNKGGNQRHRCQRCKKYFTVEHWPKGHDPKLREQALRMYLEGMSLRGIGRVIGVHHQSVANWVKEAAEQLPEQVADNTPTETVEIDELFTFVGKKRDVSS